MTCELPHEVVASFSAAFDSVPEEKIILVRPDGTRDDFQCD